MLTKVGFWQRWVMFFLTPVVRHESCKSFLTGDFWIHNCATTVTDCTGGRKLHCNIIWIFWCIWKHSYICDFVPLIYFDINVSMHTFVIFVTLLIHLKTFLFDVCFFDIFWHIHKQSYLIFVALMYFHLCAAGVRDCPGVTLLHISPFVFQNIQVITWAWA